MKATIILVLIVSTLQVNGQQNFEAIEKEYLESISGLSNTELQKDNLYKKYIRWKYFVEPRLQSEPQWIAPESSGRAFEGNWEFIGPKYYSAGPISSVAPGIGRIDVIRFHPNNDSIIFAGTPTGGLWKTEDLGQTWTCLTDALQINSLGVADLVIDPNNPDHMYLATGDGDTPTFTMSVYGVGIWETTDGGATWTPTNFGYQVSSGNWISRLLMHPTNPLIQYVAGNFGIFKTTDGWQTGSSVAATADWQDMEFQPGDPNFLYAVSQNGIYKSTSGGNSFVQKMGLNNVAKVRMAVTADNPNKVFVCNGTFTALDNVYMSNDMGETYSPITYNADILRIDIGSTYYVGSNTFDINVSPIDENAIYVGSGNVFRYDTNSWTKLVTSDIANINEEYLHGDIHTIEFNASGQLFVGCDGGFYNKQLTQNIWSDISDGLGVTQIYKIGAHDSLSDLLNIGTQDCGQMEYRANGNWEQITGSDGWYSYYHPTDPDIYYTSILFGNIYKTTDGGQTVDSIMNPANPNFTTGTNFYNYRRLSPFIMHPQQPDVLYIAQDDVYRSNDGAQNWDRRTFENKDMRNMAVSYTDPDFYYFGTTTELWQTADNGSNVNSLPINTNGEFISDITTDPANHNRVWFTLSGFDDGNKVWYSDNAGQSWTNFSTGLPNMPVNCIAYVRDSDDELYVGTDIGVYVRNNTTGGTWQYFGEMLPNIVVYDLAVNYGESKLTAGTFGRGVWESNLYTPLVLVSNKDRMEEKVIERIKVFPNPASKTITVQLENPTEQLRQINLEDITGRVHLTFNKQQLQNTNLDIGSLAKGQYIMVVGTNKARYNKVIVVN